MKKLFLFLIAICTIVLSSCTDDKNDSNSAVSYAKIKVTENGKPKAGVTVYLFDNQEGPDTDFYSAFYAKKKVITESNGVATFDLKNVFDLDVIDNQTTFYFAVFGRDGKQVLGETALTIKKGETKTADIEL